MVWWLVRPVPRRRRPLAALAEQRASLVNVKLKWVKDRSLDHAVSRERHLRPALHLLHLISSTPGGAATSRDLSLLRRATGVAAFLRRFPALFRESSPSRFHLTDAALHLRRDELAALRAAEPDLISRLRRLLMLTTARSLPLHTIDQLSWDMGLPFDYHQTLIPRYPHLFAVSQPPGDERLFLDLLSWDPTLAVSELQRNRPIDEEEATLSFPVSFTRGFGLRRKCLSWLQEWQVLPYTSPYVDASGLDPRTDISEKRIVGVFHELLHLTVAKKTERKNVSNLRKPLALPQKFTKVFERHPGIFYLSRKLDTQTVVLREGYGGGRRLVCEHPIMGVRERYMDLMRVGLPESRSNAKEQDASDGYDSFEKSVDPCKSDPDSSWENSACE